MGTFTISQTPDSKDIYLYPENNGCTNGCSAFGDIPNFECVNDDWDALEPETDYVFMDGASTVSELYAMGNHGTVTGSINYAKAYCKAKSDKYPPHINANYKVAINKGLTTGYTTLTLRPNANGAFSQWQCFPDAGESHWEDVDEAVCDNGTTTIQETVNGDKDYFGLPNHTTEIGTITKVEVFVCCNSTADTSFKLIIYDTSSTNRQTHSITCLTGSGWHSQSHVFATNPDGGSWTWGDIDDLQIGVEKEPTGLQYISQMYVEVTYESGYVCGDYAFSENMPLCTGYGSFGHAWMENPWTSTDWTWDNIDDLQVGFECSSPSVVMSPFPVLPTASGDRTDITSVTTGYEHWEAVEKSKPYAEIFESGAAWKYDLYKFIQAGAGYYPAGTERDVLPFTYNNKNYILLCSNNHGAWIYEWTGEYLKYIIHHAVDLITLCATYDGTYFYIGNTGVGDTTVKAFTFDGENFTQVGEHDAGVNNPNNISINGTIENNDGYIYYVGAANNLVALSFNGVTFTQHDTIAGTSATGLYCDGTYMHSNAHAFSFDGTSFTDICAGGNDKIWAGDDTYLYAKDEVGFTSSIVAYTFNGVIYTEVDRLNVGGLGAITDICCGDIYIYAAVDNDLRAYTFDGITIVEAGKTTYGSIRGNLITDGNFIYATDTSVCVYSFNGSQFEILARVIDGTTPKYLTDNILSVTVIAKMGKDLSAPDQADIRGCFNIKTHATEYNTSTNYYTLESIQRYYAYTWTTNPNTGIAWTLAEVQALQAGIGLYGTGTKYATCSRCYIVIGASTSVSPEIHTCQSYLKVNYTPPKSTCTLNKPKEISTNHTRNIKMMNFWDGEREVYDLNRSGKSMVLTGSEAYTGSCDRILCIREMARNGTVVEVAGLSLGYFNGEYRINQFGWRKIGEKPEKYDWVIDLESAN